MTILHTADLHLGQIMYQYYDRIDEHNHFFNQLASWCGEYRPDALVVSGDVFDIPQPGASTKEYFNNTFVNLHRRFPEMAIVITAGNHDSASRISADSPVWGLSCVTVVGHGPASNATTLPDGWQDRFIVELPSGFIVAIPFLTANRRDALQSILDRVGLRNTEGKPVVMTAHTAVSGGDFTGHGDVGTIKTQPADELGCGYDYLAMGHIHRPQTIGYPISDEYQPESTYPAGIMRYSGSALHVSCDEQYPHSVSLIDIDSHGGTVRLHRLFIDQLRHFFTIPKAGLPAARSDMEILTLIREFCSTESRGYIRLRMDYGAALPPDFQQSVYRLLEATGNEVRYNPKTIWENQTEDSGESSKPTFEVAELQQMTDPLEFIRKTSANYPELNIEELEKDFEEVRQELLNIG